MDTNREKLSKDEREKQVLWGLIELYLNTGNPVGSNALKSQGFEHLSSATIRNYFASLEGQGYLAQSHASSGRIPTDKAYQWYANRIIDQAGELPKPKIPWNDQREAGDIAAFLQESIDWLSQEVGGAVLISTPRFDHDYLTAIKPVLIDAKRVACILITHFGQVTSEILPLKERLTQHGQLRLEQYLQWRVNGSPKEEKPSHIEPEEARQAEELYQELMLRHIVSYAHFTDNEVYRSGFSHLLHQQKTLEPTLLANTLSLFENKKTMRHLLKEAMHHETISTWIGSDLKAYQEGIEETALFAAPYHIAKKRVGAIALLGTTEISYRKWIGMLYHFTHKISHALTDMVYKHQISYRVPESKAPHLTKQERLWIEEGSHPILLEDKREQT